MKNKSFIHLYRLIKLYSSSEDVSIAFRGKLKDLIKSFNTLDAFKGDLRHDLPEMVYNHYPTEIVDSRAISEIRRGFKDVMLTCDLNEDENWILYILNKILDSQEETILWDKYKKFQNNTSLA